MREDIAYRCITLAVVLQKYYSEFNDVLATLEYVSRNEFFLYSPTFINANEWVACIDNEPYCIMFVNGAFLVEAGVSCKK